MPSAQLPSDLRAALSQALAADDLSFESADLAYFGADRCKGAWQVAPAAIAFPRTVAQVQDLVRACARHRWPIVPSGGRTGLAGAATATASELVVSLTRMSKIHGVDASARLLRCEAGATVEAVHDAAAAAGLLYPIDFAAKGSAHIGGTIATNAGGVRVVRYGMTREWIQGIEVVLADGERVALGGELVKNNTGYDLRQLFIGSEGTLGIIVGATLRLCARPTGRAVALCAVAGDAEVLDLFARIRAAPVLLSAFECFDAECVARVRTHRGGVPGPFAAASAQQVLIEVIREDAGERSDGPDVSPADLLMDVLNGAAEAGVIADAVLASSSAQERLLWAWREDISEALHVATPHKADIAVPVTQVAAFLRRWREEAARRLPGIPALCFGHVGDGNLHLNLLRPPQVSLQQFLERVRPFDEVTYALVADFRGSVSAEHGIGLLKREHLHHSRSASEIALMRGIKAVFDPNSIMNPGKLLR